MSTPTPAFVGPFADAFTEFTKLIKATGAKQLSLFATLRRFDRYLAERHPQTEVLSRPIVTEWFASFSHLRPSSQRRYRSATFQLCKYLRSREPSTAAVQDFEPVHAGRSFRPYLFQPEEISTLLSAARTLAPRPTDPLRPWTIALVIVLLYTAGLRIGEVARILIRDYDPGEGTLTIRETKFAKSRLVPVSTSAKAALDSYLARRRQLGLSCAAEDSLVWPLRHQVSPTRPHLGALQSALVRLLRQIGLKPRSGRIGPRIHDIRHAFAVERVLQWYRGGADVQALLPHLATYLGHRGLESTQLYLSLTPAVLHEASARFARLAAATLHQEHQEGGTP
jgi:integrase